MTKKGQFFHFPFHNIKNLGPACYVL
ncbi:MAG: hypothetical protein ACE5EE_01310 [Fidelibacterota bacterium]